MSWFSNLAETYDRVSGIAGLSNDSESALLPPNHMMKKSEICVVIDGDGAFRRAAADKKSVNIIIPCTKKSETGRTSTAIAPHPLHEELQYLALREKYRDAYLELLEAWSGCHPKVAAVYKYVMGGTLLDNLRDSDIQDEWEKIRKHFVRFRVEIPGDLTPNLWEDMTVCKAWQDYCAEHEEGEKTLCYATGTDAVTATKHPKGINPSANGAKLISCNDETNYTYKGRFIKSEQANAIGSGASHKAHAMLKYLIATQGHKCDTQAVVAWAVDDGSAAPDPFEGSFSLFEGVKKTEAEKLNEAQGELAADYAKKLRDALRGKGNAKDLENITRRVAVMAMDAATTCRMGITFYQELLENEYIERIIAWHESCRWWFRRDGRDYISAPSVNRIIAAVYGEPKGEGYAKIQKQARERLLHNIVCGEPLDRGWVSSAVTRVSNPFSYDKQDGGWDKVKWENAMGVTCAIARKYYSQHKEGLSLDLDVKCENRDYLFGRLLAIADRLESRARYLQMGKDDTDKRPTNAVRYMSAFASKPLRTWKLVFDQLNPYIQRLNGAEWYQQQIDEIMSLFDPQEYNDNPLSGLYLLGYSLQRRALRPNKKEETTHEPD